MNDTTKAEKLIQSVLKALGESAYVVRREELPYAMRNFSPVLDVGVVRFIVEYKKDQNSIPD